MWFLWIVITAIVVLFNFTQVASFVYARIILGKELGNEVIKKRLLGLIFNSAVVLTWLILCIAVEAINKYVAVNVVSWIVFIVISIGIVNHNATDVARDAADIIGNDYPPSIDEMLKTMRELNEGYDKKSDNQTEKPRIARENYETNKEEAHMEKFTPIKLPVDEKIKPILEKYYSGKRTKNDWITAVTEMEELNRSQPCVRVQANLTPLYLNEPHGNFNGAAYWMRKKLYSAMEEEIFKKSVPVFSANNIMMITGNLDCDKAKKVSKKGYGYEIDNPIVSSWGEYAYLLNSLKPDNGELIYYFRCGNVGENAKGHIIDMYYVYVADDTIQHNLYRYTMYVDVYNFMSESNPPEDFSYDMARAVIACGSTNFDAPIKFTGK